MVHVFTTALALYGEVGEVGFSLHFENPDGWDIYYTSRQAIQ